MVDAFNDREKSFEAKYKQDQELEFKISARRNKLLGEWLAGELGIKGDAVEAYAKDVVIADLEEPGEMVEVLGRRQYGNTRSSAECIR